MATLYVVATPIGNLEDITLRAVRILRQVKLIAAEDTRKTQRLLSRYDIKTPMTSYFEHNKMTKLDYLLGRLREDDIALVSEAGMPGISDPGYELITAAQDRGISVVPIPGPSAIVTALAVSGLPTDGFHYLGFLPRRPGQRRHLLESVAQEKVTLVAYEAPHRMIEALNDILSVLGNRRVAVCRELTKLHEEVFRGRVSQAVEHFKEPRGEFTLVIEGCQPRPEESPSEDVIEQLRELRRSGVPAKEAVAKLASVSGLSRRELYKLWLKLK